jgi:hypothetical protein
VRIVVERSRDFKLVANRQALRRQTKRWRSLARSERCNAACSAISQRRHEAGAGRNAKRSRSAIATTLSVPEYPSIGAAVATSAPKALRSVGGEMPDIWWMAHEPRRSGVQRGDGFVLLRPQTIALPIELWQVRIECERKGSVATAPRATKISESAVVLLQSRYRRPMAVTIAAAAVSNSAFAGCQDPLSYFCSGHLVLAQLYRADGLAGHIREIGV